MTKRKDTIKRVKVSQMTFDPDIYPRDKVDDYAVGELTYALEAGALFPSLILDAESFRVIDGEHRRRAYERFYGEDHEPDCILRHYHNEAERILDAIRLNAVHGKRLSTHDKLVAMQRAKRLGADTGAIASALQMAEDRLMKIARAKTAIAPKSAPPGQRVLKPAATHLAGQRITKQQCAGNARLGGNKQEFIIDQVIILLENNFIRRDSEGVMNRLLRLKQLLMEFDFPQVAEELRLEAVRQ